MFIHLYTQIAITKIANAKFNLKIYFPPPYEREVWHCGERNIELIRRVVHECNWQRVFSNLNTNEKMSFFNKTILNVVSNFVSYETVICDGRDSPWTNTEIKNLINNKKMLYKKYLCCGKNTKIFGFYNLNYFKIRLLI